MKQYELEYDDHQRLCLQVHGARLTPITVDFLAGKLQHRRQYGGGLGQLIARAVGVKKLACPSVLDVTAGFGQDAFVLACLGCQVIMIERSPMIVSLLADGLKRFYQNGMSAGIRLNLVHANAMNYLQQVTQLPEVIYLDPMYPDTHQSALNKKEMQVIRELVGDDQDADALLALALQKATRRVVVKRPRQGIILGNQKPDVVFAGKSSRFDVYMIT